MSTSLLLSNSFVYKPIFDSFEIRKVYQNLITHKTKATVLEQ